jgi:hypothetical protein
MNNKLPSIAASLDDECNERLTFGVIDNQAEIRQNEVGLE